MKHVLIQAKGSGCSSRVFWYIYPRHDGFLVSDNIKKAEAPNYKFQSGFTDENVDVLASSDS